MMKDGKFFEILFSGVIGMMKVVCVIIILEFDGKIFMGCFIIIFKVIIILSEGLNCVYYRVLEIIIEEMKIFKL